MWNTGGSKMNVAVRVMAWATTNAQAQAPCQPEKVDEAAGCAVSEITVPWLKLLLHVAPQLIPPGRLVTLPAPFPTRPTVNV